MNILNGFAVIPGLFNATPGQTVQFGELSDRSESFSLTKAEYVDGVNYPGVQATLFSALSDAGSQITPTAGVIGHILAVISWVYSQYNASAIPPQSSQAAFLTALATQFPTNTSAWSINTIINGTPTTQRMPDYIQWHYQDSGTDNLLKIWFCDASFQAQYSNYTILLIPPTPTIDNLNAPATAVAALLSQYTTANLVADITTKQNGVPATGVVTQSVTYVDPTVVAPAVPGTINTTWTAVVYGAAGLSSDAVKAAIELYIGAHSTLTNWTTIYPGLYSSNEFVVIPLWQNVAVPPAGADPVLYSSAILPGNTQSIASQLLPSTYAQSTVLSVFMTAHMRLMASVYSAIQALVVGNPNNAGGLYDLLQLYPDYTDIDTSSGDFGRMAAATQAFCTQLVDALTKAAVLTLSSSVPGGYTRVVRNNLVYLSFTMPGFTVGSVTVPAMTWLVLSKASYNVV